MGEPVTGYVRHISTDGFVRLRAEPYRHSPVVFEGQIDADGMRIARDSMCFDVPITLVMRPDGSWKVREPTHAQREVVRLIAAHQREHGPAVAKPRVSGCFDMGDGTVHATISVDARNVDAVCERIRDAVRRAKT